MMHDWNVVVSVRADAYRAATNWLQTLGAVAKTEYYNVLVMRVADIPATLEAMRAAFDQDPSRHSLVNRFSPVTVRFSFQTIEQFEARARESVAAWLPQLTGRSFHVRMHRRGFKGRLASDHEERLLDSHIMSAIGAAATSARVSFDDPDAIIVIETVGQDAGLALWARDELVRYPFLRLDG